MIPLLISAWCLLRGIATRAYFLLFALFLDPIDLYSRFFPEAPALPLPGWAIWAVFWGALGVAVLLAYHEVRMKVEKASVRVPLLQLRDFCAQKGWNVTGNGKGALEIFDIADAVQQSVMFGEAKIWGRHDKWGQGSMGLTKDEPRTFIHPDHFKTFGFDVINLANAKENGEIYTYCVGANGDRTRDGYRDLVLEVSDLKLWERNARSDFKGRRDAEYVKEERLRIDEEAEH